MNKVIPTYFLITVVLVISACAATDPSAKDTGIATIDTPTAKNYFDRAVLFIDVRGDSYDDGHIPGSINIYWNGEFNEDRLGRAASKNQEVVFYCDGPSCGLSIKASRAAISWGYQRVYHYYEGYPAWKTAGYPVAE